MPDQIEIGRLLRSSTSGFVVGCRVSQLDLPSFGALVRAPLGEGFQVYGLIHDIQVGDDGLVRQIVTADSVSPEVVRDNRERRIVPVELSVRTVGYARDGVIHHMLPPRPPVSLDLIYLCDQQDLRSFTEAGHYGYFRLLLGAPELPVAELLAVHIQKAQAAQADGGHWKDGAVGEVIALLRDDYSLLTSVLGALREGLPRA
jgi:hypothetical protein